ncbi:MAG: response regulator [Desulfobacteraceae bacterium]|nr:response regulator [Desulfobacteraceae bacterium]
MFDLVQKKIAVKLAGIIVLVVTLVSAVSVVYFNRANSALLMSDLENEIANAVKLSEMVYSQSLWNFDDNEVSRLNNALLKNDIIVAINVYNMAGLVRSHQKDGLNAIQLTAPFELSEENPLHKMVTSKIKRNDELLGNFELFYTEELIAAANKEASIRMIVSFAIIAALITVVVFFVLDRLAIQPVLTLAKHSRTIAETSDYSVRIERQERKDEVGTLVNGFINMLKQINTKDRERQELYTTLKKSEKKFRSIFDKLQKAIDTEDYSLRITPESRDDDLANSLNKMIRSLEVADIESTRQNWLKTGQNELNSIIAGEQNIERLCLKAITYIADYLGAQVGTFFVEEKKDLYKLVATYAFTTRKGIANRFAPGEGLAGQAALEKKRIVFSQVPESYIKVSSSLGNAQPASILVLPLVYEDSVKGVMELGSVSEFTDDQLEFVEMAGNTLGVAINTALFNEQLAALLDRTQEQAEELRVQQEELKTANQELEEQTESLKKSEAKLQLQQEELQASNEELEEKTELLESQKDEIEKKNSILKVQQKEVEEKAKQLEIATRYKSEFLANMSHELRTPLNSLLILANMLAENQENNLTEDQVESAASIHRSGQNLLHLINDILDLSKIEARKIELSISSISMESLLSNVRSEFMHVARKKNLDFTTSLKENVPTSITTDVHRLEQILRNLVGNAMKFTKQGAVSLSVSRPSPGISLTRKDLDPDRTVAIAIEDTGLGISKEKIGIIFEAFKQVDGSISRRHGGTGLGLSISRELALLLGGEIQVESHPGKGTVFTLYIPEVLSHPAPEEKAVSEPAPEPRTVPAHVPAPEPLPPRQAEPPRKEPAPMEAPKADAAPGRRTMLIIEDDNEFASILAKFFRENGYDSIVAENGEIGIKHAIEQRPTAITLDIGLPGIDGWTVLNELKRNPATRHIPVHIMSAFDNTRQGLEKGAVGYLTKPISQDDLKQALGRIEDILASDVKELLVVEDNTELRKSILKLLTTHDINAVAVGTGVEAIELLKKKRFDCMILDLGLPDISGFELLDRINSDHSLETTPVIIYTGRELSQEENEKLERYASSIVVKSAVSMERLLDETALFMHRVESDMPEQHQKMIQKVRDKGEILPGKRVLLVDDDMRNAFALNKFLKSRGMKVTIANNGQKALDILDKGEKVDIVLMDIMMPVMDGYETMKRIRKQEKFKSLPILALTAKAMETDREECIRCGANDYLSKPVDTNKLITMLRVWLY